MKKRKTIKRLAARQNSYDAMVRADTQLKASFRRPGSEQK